MLGVCAYNEWHRVSLCNPSTYDGRILRSDLNDIDNLSKSDFEYAMCRFIVEVVKLMMEVITLDIHCISSV